MILDRLFVSSLLYCKNAVHHTCNTRNMCQSAVYVISKASGQHRALSKVSGDSKVIWGLLTARGVEGLVLLTPILYKGQLYDHFTFLVFSINLHSPRNGRTRGHEA